MGNKFAPDFAHFDPLSAVRQSLGPVARTYGRKRVISGNFEVATGDLDLNDIIIICPIPSAAVLHSLKLTNDDLDGAAVGLIDIGICDKDGADVNTGAGDSREMLLNDSTIFRAVVLPSQSIELANQGGQNAVDIHGAQMWERINIQTAGTFSADPNRLWFICLRINVLGTPQAGTIGYKTEYTLD